MTENVPRRLRRFYRQKNSSYENDGYDDSDYSSVGIDSGSVGSLPTMEYEDVDEKNFEEIKKTEINNLEEKLAMMEIEKFKKENKRLPNKKEQETLASNLYEQFKNDPEHEEIEKSSPQRSRHRDRRKENKDQEEMNLEKEENINEPDFLVSSGNDIKSLLGDSAPKKKKSSDDFDLGLDLDSGDDDLSMSDDLAELEDFSLEGKKKKKKE